MVPELPEPPDLHVPPPPEAAEDLLAWAKAHAVDVRLDDVLIGQDGQAGAYLPGRPGEVLTYRQILLARETARRPGVRDDAEETARRYLHRIAELTARASADSAHLAAHGRDPVDDALVRFLGRVRAELGAIQRTEGVSPRPRGTYEPAGVHVGRTPVPHLRYDEWPLAETSAPGPERLALLLLGWNEGAAPWRWARVPGDGSARDSLPEATRPPAAELRLAALAAFVDFLRDPRAAPEQDALAELLYQPAWQYALGALDERLARLEVSARPRAADERIGYRVLVRADGAFDVEPIVQKRARGGAFSKGARVPWFQLAERRDLGTADRRAFQAYDDRFARRSSGWGGTLAPAQVHGILRALIDHPAVFLGSEGENGTRLDIRPARLRLGFGADAEGGLVPQFELGGVTLDPATTLAALADDRHLLHLHRRPGAPPLMLLAEVSAQAAALVRALAAAPARFPPEAHDALARRLESLQESVDIEFPSRFTRTITPAAARPLARLELVGWGAIELSLWVRPIARGPVFAPGEGPPLLLEGAGRDRHGVRRDLHAERTAAHALVEALDLGEPEARGAWCWRVAEGDPAFALVAALAEQGAAVEVEWTDDNRLVDLGSVGRGDLRLRVGDRHEFFSVEGGAHKGTEVVPLGKLLAAIQDGRRFVAVGKHGFARIEDSLRAALARAEATLHGQGELHLLPRVATDALVALVDDEDDLKASAAFWSLRKRIAEGEGTTPVLPPAIDALLRPYQRAGVTWLARLGHWGAGAILADEMGLGKTVQTLAVLAHRAERGPALVVAPTSVVGNWVAEAARFVPGLRLRLYRGGERAAVLQGLGAGDIVVTSYAVAALDADALARVRFATLVLDEAQALKNAATERSKALRGLDAEWRIGLTGTPIENHLGELWSLFRVISPGLFGSWEDFRARYAIPVEKFADEARRQELAARLRPFILRRTKAEVARELPPRTEIVRLVQLSAGERALYEELRTSALAELAEAKKHPDRDAGDLRFVMLSVLTRLRQLCCHPRLVYPDSQAGSAKAAHLIELCGELREGGHRTLVFSQFRSFLELLTPRLRQHGLRVLVLDGTTPAEAREERIAAFQAGAADVFCISLKAGGFGLNLTAADHVIHLDPWWNPAVEDQATARAHRLGQQRPVTAVRLVAAGTVEETVLGLHAAKRALAAGVLEGTDAAGALSVDELVALVRGSSSPLLGGTPG